jgi:hypothetical protein
MWVLKENIKSKLRVFERKVLRGMYGPSKESDGTWRIKSNDKLNRLIGNKNTINYIKAQRLAQFGHVHHMPDNSMVKKVYEWTPALTRSTRGFPGSCHFSFLSIFYEFKSKLLSKKSKLRMYQTLVRPVVTHACEMWVLKENI